MYGVRGGGGSVQYLKQQEERDMKKLVFTYARIDRQYPGAVYVYMCQVIKSLIKSMADLSSSISANSSGGTSFSSASSDRLSAKP